MFVTLHACRLGDEALLQQLLFDAVVTAPLEAYWNTLMLSDRCHFFFFTHFLLREEKPHANMTIQSKISGGCSVCRGPGHETCSGSRVGARAPSLPKYP